MESEFRIDFQKSFENRLRIFELRLTHRLSMSESNHAWYLKRKKCLFSFEIWSKLKFDLLLLVCI